MCKLNKETKVFLFICLFQEHERWDQIWKRYVCYVFKPSQLFCYHSRSNLAPLDTGKLSVSKSLLMNSFTFVSIFGSLMSWGSRKVVTLKETILIMVKTMEPVTRSKPSNALNQLGIKYDDMMQSLNYSPATLLTLNTWTTYRTRYSVPEVDLGLLRWSSLWH